MARLFKRKNSPYYDMRDGEFKKSLKTTDLATAKSSFLSSSTIRTTDFLASIVFLI